MTTSTEILQRMVDAEGHIEVLKGPTGDEYITVCRPDGTALYEGLLPRDVLDDFKKAWFVTQDGAENERGVTTFKLTADGRAKGRSGPKPSAGL
jgi:hypothetical protein